MTAQPVSIAVNAAALCESESDVARSIEALARAAAGLALEGISVQVTAVTYDDEEDTT